ncbi:MAG: hypothetical protein P1Q69_20900 [Candidatus Thorarchaeota archaeon]|nr:hypothetical protein [Candidatus Thorarchaeota archaeon]
MTNESDGYFTQKRNTLQSGCENLAQNFTIEVAIYFSSFAVNFFAFIATFWFLRGEKHRHAPFIVAIFFGLSLWSLFISLGGFLLNSIPIRLGLYTGIATIALVFLMIDSFTRDGVDARKTALLSVAGTLLVYYS